MAKIGGDAWLAGICGSRILLSANYMVYAGCLPILRETWDMSAAQAGSVAAGFSIGYALSLVTFSALADRLGACRVVVWSAWSSAATALAFGLFARSYETALVLYFLVAFTQGGVYTPVVMVLADRYAPARRGRAVGWMIGSTSIAYASSLVLTGLTLSEGDYRLAFVVTGILPLLGAAWLVWVLRATPNTRHRRQRGTGLLDVLRRNVPARRLLFGYVAHAWEVLGVWAWLPAFLAASLVVGGAATDEAAGYGAYIAGALHLFGATAAATMGGLSDRLGRRFVLVVLAGTGAVISLLFGWLIAVPFILLLVIAGLYAFAVIGDSPVLSTAITEVVDPGCLGDILALRSLLGFGAGAVSSVAFGAILDLFATGPDALMGWGWAFMALGLGGTIATACAWGLRGSPR